MQMKKSLITVAVIFVFVVLFTVTYEVLELNWFTEEVVISPVLRPDGELVINDETFFVEIADTSESRIQGLSGKEPIGSNEGMLFVFEENGEHGIWMKDMLFSLDILWFDEHFEIVHIEENISPDTFPTTFSSDVPARYVLELAEGGVGLHGLVVGDMALLNQFPVPSKPLREVPPVPIPTPRQ